MRTPEEWINACNQAFVFTEGMIETIQIDAINSQQKQSIMTNKKKFEITIELKDYRETEGMDSDKQVLCYCALIHHGNKHCAVWSEPLQDDEVNTRRSYFNLLDGIRHRIIKQLCPEDPFTIPPNYQTTKQQ